MLAVQHAVPANKTANTKAFRMLASCTDDRGFNKDHNEILCHQARPGVVAFLPERPSTSFWGGASEDRKSVKVPP